MNIRRRFYIARYASLRWNDKKQKWQLRLGSAKVVGEWDNTPEQYQWAIAWGRHLSRDNDLPFRLIHPSDVEMPLPEGIEVTPNMELDEPATKNKGYMR